MIVLIVGGSKSGKSRIAQEIAKQLDTGGGLCYFATMKPTDGEDVARIKRHLAERDGLGFTTVERSENILEGEAMGEGATVLFDSLTALVANEMFKTVKGEFVFDASSPERVLADTLELAKRVKNIVFVADDILRDGGIFDAYTNAYLKGLAHIVRGIAKEANAVYEACAGSIVAHKGEAIFINKGGME